MEKRDIVLSILSKDEARIAEARVAIKGLLDAKMPQFRANATKFIAKSLFEAKIKDEDGDGQDDDQESVEPEEQISDHDYDPLTNLRNLPKQKDVPVAISAPAIPK